MRNALIYTFNNDSYLQNRMFEQNIFLQGLQKFLRGKEILLETIDKQDPENADKIIFFDVPYPWKRSLWNTIYKYRHKTILFCFESPVINPFNFKPSFHKDFNKIYTWDDRVIDNKRYVKFLYPQTDLNVQPTPIPFKDKKFLTLINANKSPFIPFLLVNTYGKELYSERMRAIDYFQKTIPNDFSLYGRGWNEKSKFSLRDKIIPPKKYPVYKGEIKDKIEILKTFKYSICFENATQVQGYITEKIIDSLKARCVPIYWGANNIDEYIPEECYIDYRDFMSYSRLFQYLVKIKENEYANYINNIDLLMNDRDFLYRWSSDAFYKTFYKAITNKTVHDF